ncbi:protein of unknown function [Candidatus Methylomirabilis oxygeniifera]|uniref:Uncharacterized protein n=1 Tax=Methylomirabilis oxygeniifera TaxID=671143 RepID=D5MLS7_METO1|nr:protein of unknown function [Candidatus Methylomirabilis oxyfera]
MCGAWGQRSFHLSVADLRAQHDKDIHFQLYRTLVRLFVGLSRPLSHELRVLCRRRHCSPGRGRTAPICGTECGTRACERPVPGAPRSQRSQTR